MDTKILVIIIIIIILVIICCILRDKYNTNKFMVLNKVFSDYYLFKNNISINNSQFKDKELKVIDYVSFKNSYDDMFALLLKNFNIRYYNETVQDYKPFSRFMNKIIRNKDFVKERLLSLLTDFILIRDDDGNYYTCSIGTKGDKITYNIDVNKLHLIYMGEWSKYIGADYPLNTLITIYSKDDSCEKLYKYLIETYSTTQTFNNVIIQTVPNYESQDYIYKSRIYNKKRENMFLTIENRDSEYFYYYDAKYETDNKNLEKFIINISSEGNLFEFGTYDSGRINESELFKTRFELNNLSINRLIIQFLETGVLFPLVNQFGDRIII